MDLTISIVNYNVSGLLKQCLASIYKETHDIDFEVYVADNASVDDSVAMVKREFPRVKLIENKQNLFFAKAHNQVLQEARGRYVCILNNDTVIMNNAFKTMVTFMDSHPGAGACGPKLLNPDMTDQGNGLAFPSLLYGLFEVTCLNVIVPSNTVRNNRFLTGWARNNLREVDTVGGACMMVRSSLLDTVGMLDDTFVMYWEETDWCLRIKNAGNKIYFIPDATVLHIERQGVKQIGFKKYEHIYNNSMLYYYRKHYGNAVYLLLKAIQYPVSYIIKLKRLLTDK